MPANCEVCGKPSSVHLTEFEPGSSQKRQHSYCLQHVPPEIKSKMPSIPPEEDVVENLFARIDLIGMEEARKAGLLDELERLLEPITIACEVCGEPSMFHITEVEADGSRKPHHYCEDHAPPGLPSEMTR